MDFELLFKRISRRLKKIARHYSKYCCLIDEADLYQEMCMHLWNDFRKGVPDNINDSYIIKGCEFYILNYLRKEREKTVVVSLEKPFNERGDTLKDVLESREESVDKYVERKITVETMMNNGFSKREKQVFSLLLKGYTTRAIGKRLGISHVMVIKYKKRLADKWHKKEVAVLGCWKV